MTEWPAPAQTQPDHLVSAFAALQAEVRRCLQQDAHRALELARQARDQAKALRDPALVARSEGLLGAAHYLRAEYAEAEPLLTGALRASVRHADVVGQTHCLSYLGYLAHAQGRFAEATLAFLQLLDLPHPDPTSRDAEAHGGLAMVYSTLGDSAASLDHQLAALHAQRQRPDQAGLAMALSNVGVDYRDLGQLDEAARYAQEALALARAQGDVRTETAALFNLGLDRLAQGQLDEAEALFHETVALGRRAGLARRVVWGLQGLGQLHTRAGRPAQALAPLQEALALCQSGQLRAEEVACWLRLGQAQAALAPGAADPAGGCSAALHSLHQALDGALSIGHLIDQAEARRALADAYEGAGRPAEALAQLRAHLALRDGHEHERSRQRAELLAARFGAEERRREYERLQAHARTLEEDVRLDALTGLINRRGLDAELQAALVRAQRTGAPLCLAMLDLDHFKQVNDTHTHAVGDEVLRVAAALFQSATRVGDLVARFGGEEFVVVLPDTPLEAAGPMLERLRARIEGHAWPDLRPQLAVTVSVGLVQAGEGGADALLAAADASLYAAKRAGRNRVWAGPA